MKARLVALLCALVAGLVGGIVYLQLGPVASTSPGGTSGAAFVSPSSPALPADRERLARAQAVVEALFGRRFAREVPLVRQSEAQFREHVQHLLDRELPPAKAARQAQALALLGLLPAGYDLRAGVLELYATQAGAYYDPEARRMVLLAGALPESEQHALLVHELAHALRDERSDLARGLAAARAAGDDAAAAYQAACEGEAYLAQTSAQLAAARGVAPTLSATPERTAVVAAVRDLPRAALLGQMKAAAERAGPEGARLARSIAALETLPGLLFWALHAPYLRGQALADAAMAKGGIPGLDALFERPPTSTEQVLHPEKLLRDGGPETPYKVLMPADPILKGLGPGFALVHEESLGELGMRSLAEGILGAETREEIDRFAQGWGGDRFALFEGPPAAPGGPPRRALVWRYVGETQEDGLEVAELLGKVPADGDRLLGHRGRLVVLLVGAGPAASAVVKAAILTPMTEGGPR